METEKKNKIPLSVWFATMVMFVFGASFIFFMAWDVVSRKLVWPSLSYWDWIKFMNAYLVLYAMFGKQNQVTQQFPWN
jgi:hypothetical protein